jgi:hypothetical protein
LVGAPRHAVQLATWQPEPTGVGAGVGAAVRLLLILRFSTPSVDDPLATQLEPVAVCSTVKPCETKEQQLKVVIVS